MLIATWNINSIRARLSHVLRWLNETKVDVLCLQETKVVDALFPQKALEEIGYQSFFTGESSYNGVAILVKKSISVSSKNIISHLPNYIDQQKRLLALTIDDIRFICVYVPNGENINSTKYHYKLSWLAKFKTWLEHECKQYTKLAILGDFNIAPENQDVQNPERWTGHVLFSDKEKAAFQDLISMNLIDAFRLFPQPLNSYSWWDYRALSFQRNAGLRIDHILLSKQLSQLCINTYIDKEQRKLPKPSDHAPVIATLLNTAIKKYIK